jgi:hypothetical protein
MKYLIFTLFQLSYAHILVNRVIDIDYVGGEVCVGAVCGNTVRPLVFESEEHGFYFRFCPGEGDNLFRKLPLMNVTDFGGYKERMDFKSFTPDKTDANCFIADMKSQR